MPLPPSAWAAGRKRGGPLRSFFSTGAAQPSRHGRCGTGQRGSSVVGPAVRTTLAAAATCAIGRRTTAANLPPGALRRPRAEVLALLGVSDPDDACHRWWDGALAAALPTTFPGVPTGLLALRGVNVALGVVTLQDRDRLPRLSVEGPGFHHSVLIDFRDRLAEGVRADRLPDLALEKIRATALKDRADHFAFGAHGGA